MESRRIGLMDARVPASMLTENGPVDVYYFIETGKPIPNHIHLAWYYHGIYFEDLAVPRQLTLFDMPATPKSLEVV